jgi:hypothetical protein
MNTKIELTKRPGFGPAEASKGHPGLQMPERSIYDDSMVVKLVNPAWMSG